MRKKTAASRRSGRVGTGGQHQQSLPLDGEHPLVGAVLARLGDGVDRGLARRILVQAVAASSEPGAGADAVSEAVLAAAGEALDRARTAIAAAEAAMGREGG